MDYYRIFFWGKLFHLMLSKLKKKKKKGKCPHKSNFTKVCTSTDRDSSQEFFPANNMKQKKERKKNHKASSVPTPELNFSGQFGEDFENSIWSLKLGNKTVTLLWDVRLSSSLKIHFEVSWKRSHNLPLNSEQTETKVLTLIFELAFIPSHKHC